MAWQLIIFIPPLLLLSPLPCQMGAFPQSAAESTCVHAGAALWLSCEGGLFFTEINTGQAQHILCSLSLSPFLCSDTARTLGGGVGRLTSPPFPSTLPKTSMKCVQLKDSLSPRVIHSAYPTAPRPAWFHSLKENRKSVQADSCSAHILHVRRAAE